MTTQTDAERLAYVIEGGWDREHGQKAAAELRRLVSFNQQLMDEVARLQKREWVGLTRDEVLDIEEKITHPLAFYDAIEAKLKEKNT